jgi:hypothetical protein
MWQQLSVLALCGMSALRADVCEGLPTGPSTGSGSPFYEDLGAPPPVSFRLSVKDGGPTFRITVRPVSFDSLRHNRDPNLVHAGDIEVARCQDGKRLQLLPIMAWQPLNFGATFHADDINFDGYLDFSVRSEYAASWESKSYWVYDPGSELFVENELTRELGENCFAAAHGDCWQTYAITFDSKKQEISTHHFGLGNTGCGAGADRYRVKNNRLILIHKEEITQSGPYLPRDCIVTISELIGGTMRVTGVRRGDAPEQSVK